MLFESPLKSATLIKRYKRFLADVITPEGKGITLHCANTGAMTGCATPGDIVWYSTSTNPKRKYPYSWELTQTSCGDWICVNTLRANNIVKEALQQQLIPELKGYEYIESEVKYGQESSRIDFLLKSPNQVNCFIEVKSVSLLKNNGLGSFPDAVTLRGQKHLRELQAVKQHGQRAVLFFLVLHTGIHFVTIAKDIDPIYHQLLLQAKDHGVEIICYSANITCSEIIMKYHLPLLIDTK